MYLRGYGGEDHLNDRLWLRATVWQHRSKSVTVAWFVAVYSLNAGVTPALSVTKKRY